jgi:cardiolipin synthase
MVTTWLTGRAANRDISAECVVARRSGGRSDASRGSLDDDVTIPNFITLGRVFLVPVIFWLLVSDRMQVAFLLFVVAGISDAVDGFLAKRFNWQSELGSYLDPLADKLLIVSIFVTMGVLGKLPSWLVVAVVSRDILILLGIGLAWLMGALVAIKPSNVSKANTAAQIVLASSVLADEGFSLGLGMFRQAMIWITAGLTAASLVHYASAWIALMTGNADKPG